MDRVGFARIDVLAADPSWLRQAPIRHEGHMTGAQCEKDSSMDF